ncbi:MAG TPA: oligosaccharide flippase family protein [Terriglobia bacterium]|nr:oligosaccharide flippase family protein [Terriglobia bacterium]
MSEASITFLGSFSKKLVANTFFNLLGRSWKFVLTLLLTPYILSRIGVNEFGVWALFSSVLAGSFTLLDVGLSLSFVKFISAYHVHQDYRRISDTVSLGLVFYAIFGIAIVGVGLAIESPLLDFFHIDAARASDAYLLALVGCAVSNVGAVFLSVFRGIQRMDKSNTIEMRMALVNAAGTVLVLELGLGLFGLALNAVVNAALSGLVSWKAMRRIMPDVSIHFRFDRALLREMFAYASKIQVSRLGTLVCFQLDKLIISRMFGIGAVSFYEIGSRLALMMRSIPLVMISALIPATSELEARNEREKVLRAYVAASKYVTIITVALGAYLVIEAEPLLNLWLGKGFDAAVMLTKILAIGYAFNILGGVASQTGAGVGRPEFDMRSTALLSVTNPILSLILVQRFGPAGAATGTALALMVASAYLIHTFHRNYAGTSAWTAFLDIYFRPFLAGSLASVAVLGFHRITPSLVVLDSVRWMIPLKMALDLGIFSVVYFGLLIGLRQVTTIDRDNFMGLMAFGFEFLRHPFRERVKIYR